ncbi:hypothetical protein ABIB25_000226 [Nakamurella sp. UYEF19]
MMDTEPQAAAGKVLWHFTLSLDGFIAGPDQAMDWMTGFSIRPDLVDEYVETTGAVLGGRDGFGAYPDVSSVYGGAWHGEIFILTHHPEDAQASDGVTFLSLRCGRGRPDRARQADAGPSQRADRRSRRGWDGVVRAWYGRLTHSCQRFRDSPGAQAQEAVMEETTGYEFGSGFGEGEYGGYDLSGETDPITGYVDSNNIVEVTTEYDPAAAFDDYIQS